MYDLIIIGGGPAAITAGIYAGRKKLKTLLITEDWGGQMALTSIIENYPGYLSISGMELTDKMKEQLKKNQIEIKDNIEVNKIEKGKIIKINDSYQAKSLIIAHGRVPKKLNIPGEDKFKGKGLSYCVHCDAPFFKDKDVAVIGGGNAGLEAVLDLTNYAQKIYLFEYMDKLAADEILQDKIKEYSQISVLTNAAVKEIKGDNFVKSLIYQDRKTEKINELSIQGVFSEIGWIANSSFLKDVVELNKAGEIKINKDNVSSEPNIFAAGDNTEVFHKQIVIAAGEGAKAALSAYQYLKK